MATIDGELIYHTLSTGDTIVEGRSATGLPLWYAIKVRENVCLSGLCNRVHIWIYWDCLGDFKDFELLELEPLTKREHEVFTKEDYVMLDNILKSENHLFKYINYEDLVNSENSTENGVDGYTGATSKDIKQYVIEGAAYTCYVLWKKVYGSLRKNVQVLSRREEDRDYIRLLFESKEVVHRELAVDILAENTILQKQHFSEILDLFRSQNEYLSLIALSSINQVFSELAIQIQILDNFESYSMRLRQEIVWKFYSLTNVDSSIVVNLLEQFRNGYIGPNELTLVFEMVVSQSQLDNIKVRNTLDLLSDHSNSYVRRVASELLGE